MSSQVIPKFSVNADAFGPSQLIKDPKFNTDPKLQERALTQDVRLIVCFKASREQWLRAIKIQADLWIKSEFIADPTFYTVALKVNPDLIFQVQNPTDDMLITAIKVRASIITQISKPSETLWSVALAIDGMLLGCCPEQTTMLQRVAIEQNYRAVLQIRQFNFDHCLIAVSRHPEAIKLLYARMNEEAVKKLFTLYPDCIQHLAVQTEIVQKIAVEKNSALFQYCYPQYASVVEMALKLDPKNIRYVKDQTLAMVKNFLPLGHTNTFCNLSLLQQIESESIAAEQEATRKQEEAAAKLKAANDEKKTQELVAILKQVQSIDQKPDPNQDKKPFYDLIMQVVKDTRFTPDEKHNAVIAIADLINK